MSNRSNRKDFQEALERVKKVINLDTEFQEYWPPAKVNQIEISYLNIIIELILEQKEQINQLKDIIRDNKGQVSSSDEDNLIKAFKNLSISPDGIIRKNKPITEYKYFIPKPAKKNE